MVFFVHGWMWNRLGNIAGRVPFVDQDVDFLPTVKALHDAGFHVLLFDLANHGESAVPLPDHLRPVGGARHDRRRRLPPHARRRRR